MRGDCESVLKIIGLSNNEAMVYVALLHEPNVTANQIAAVAGMKPSTVRDNLDSLSQKRLATRKLVKRGPRSVSEWAIRDRNEVLKRIHREVKRQLSDRARIAFARRAIQAKKRGKSQTTT